MFFHYQQTKCFQLRAWGDMFASCYARWTVYYTGFKVSAEQLKKSFRGSEHQISIYESRWNFFSWKTVQIHLPFSWEGFQVNWFWEFFKKVIYLKLVQMYFPTIEESIWTFTTSSELVIIPVWRQINSHYNDYFFQNDVICATTQLKTPHGILLCIFSVIIHHIPCVLGPEWSHDP